MSAASHQPGASHANEALPRPGSLRHARGLSMVEVLVSLVVLALGLIGAARLLTSAVQNAAATDTSARASQLASSIIDDMRAQPATPGAYALALNSDPSAINAATVAGENLQRWLRAVKTLPGGDASIAVAGNVATVTVSFSDCAGTLSQQQLDTCLRSAPPRNITYEARL